MIYIDKWYSNLYDLELLIFFLKVRNLLDCEKMKLLNKN